MSKQKEISIDPKPELRMGFDLKHEELSERLQDTLEDYILSSHGISEDSKGNYASQVRTFGRFLMNREIKRFEDVSSRDIDLFLSNYKKDSTKNVYIIRFKHFYGTFLKLPSLVEHLKMVNEDLPLITPSELLIPDEVVGRGL